MFWFNRFLFARLFFNFFLFFLFFLLIYPPSTSLSRLNKFHSPTYFLSLTLSFVSSISFSLYNASIFCLFFFSFLFLLHVKLFVIFMFFTSIYNMLSHSSSPILNNFFLFFVLFCLFFYTHTRFVI